MSETNKTIIIIFVGFIALINLTMISWAFTRRSAEDLVKITKTEHEVLLEKMERDSQNCKESGGIADWYSDYVSCKRPN